MQALSRYREFAADRGAAVITGRPSALASALLKISGAMSASRSRTCAPHGEMNAFFIVPARVKNVDLQPLRDAPADGEAHRARCRASRPSCRAPRAPR